MTCDEARERIPFYAARALPEPEGAALLGHVVGCELCQGELVEAMRLGHELRAAFARLPGPPARTWQAIAARTVGASLLEVGVGSEIAGLTLAVGATKSGFSVMGSLSLLGREVPVLRI
ncbi:MAG: anti-sigma factor [Candidatus Bipolaricaulis sp.]|jgi:hypothetical protein